MTELLYIEALALLKRLIAAPSFSGDEAATATIIEGFLQQKGIAAQTHGYNVWAQNKYFNPDRPTLLLNSHHDTVKPNKAYTTDPFNAIEEDGRLYGLGSNDAGGSVVSLIGAFSHFYEQEDLQYNLVLAITAEEEISGKNGIESLLPLLPRINAGIVGEPTLLQMAVAERGLMVVDALATGRAGHAARGEGENAIYKAMMDLEWIYCYQFEKTSNLLGPVKMTVTAIETDNKTHNIIPSECRYLVDVRLNEHYSHEEVFNIMQEQLQASLTMRSSRLRSTMIALDHPLVKAGIDMGLHYYGSPTASDKALMPFPALKIGPGDSARSHTADEFICTGEIRDGIQTYIHLLNKVLK